MQLETLYYANNWQKKKKMAQKSFENSAKNLKNPSNMQQIAI